MAIFCVFFLYVVEVFVLKRLIKAWKRNKLTTSWSLRSSGLVFKRLDYQYSSPLFSSTWMHRFQYLSQSAKIVVHSITFPRSIYVIFSILSVFKVCVDAVDKTRIIGIFLLLLNVRTLFLIDVFLWLVSFPGICFILFIVIVIVKE